jgi:hypothetical protein
MPVARKLWQLMRVAMPAAIGPRGRRAPGSSGLTWPGHQPIEQHADGGEVLLDARLCHHGAELLG